MLGEKYKNQYIWGLKWLAKRLRKLGIRVLVYKSFDFKYKFDFEDNFFDIFHSNQVIEHLYDTDNYQFRSL
jgi:hypothetical protein